MKLSNLEMSEKSIDVQENDKDVQENDMLLAEVRRQVNGEHLFPYLQLPSLSSSFHTNLVPRVFRLFGQRGNAGTSNFITAGFLR